MGMRIEGKGNSLMAVNHKLGIRMEENGTDNTGKGGNGNVRSHYRSST